MRRIAVAMAKGGVAKTATAIVLAHGLALRGNKVLVVDTDIQGHVAERLGVAPETGLADTMSAGPQPEHRFQARENMWVLTGGNGLVNIKHTIEKFDDREERVVWFLTQHEDSFDYIIIDTGPGWDSVTAGALRYSDEVVCPITLDPDNEDAFVQFVGRLTDMWQQHSRPVLRYILPTRYDHSILAHRKLLSAFRKAYGAVVCEPIRKCINTSYAFREGQTIFEYDHRATAAKDYNKFIERVITDGR